MAAFPEYWYSYTQDLARGTVHGITSSAESASHVGHTDPPNPPAASSRRQFYTLDAAPTFANLVGDDAMW